MQFSRSPRLAVSAMFIVNGMLLGAWAARVPAFVEQFDLDPAGLAQVLLCLAAGAIVSFPLAGRLSDRIGAATATRVLVVLYALGLPLLAIAPSVVGLAVLLAVFGAAHGAMDVTMNAWATEVERAQERPILSSFHAMWSLGAGLGAASGWWAVQAGLSPGPHFVAVAVIATVPGLWIAARPWQSTRASAQTGFALPSRSLLLVGGVALCASIGEGAMVDWSAVFLTVIAEADEATAALGYGVYSVAMVVARLSADRMIAILGPVATARICGSLAALGLAIAILGASLTAGLIGFSLVGLGYSVMVPLAFSRAANQPGVPAGRALASVATLGYGGMLLGPVLIGGIAQVTSLAVGFGLLAVMALLILALAPALRPAK